MKVDLNSFEREKAIDETLSAESVDLELANVTVDGPVRLIAEAVKTSSGVGIAGNLTGTVEIDCDRCLEPVKRPLEIELDLEFASLEQLEDDANHELHADDMKLDAMDGNLIDLAAVAREQILLDLPQQFFCKNDCRGLCEKCGTNLNLKGCDCEDNEIDPRWAALKNFN